MKHLLLVGLAAFAATGTFACDGFVVGRKASASGRVIVAHNEDNLPKHRIRYSMLPSGAPLFEEPGCAKIPQVAKTYACFWSEVYAADGDPRPGDLFYNEKGVMVYSNNGGVYEDWYGAKYSLPDEGYYSSCRDGGLGINLRFAVVQRARTAAEGVSIMTNLVMTYGYHPLSRIFTIADKDEAWLVQVLHGRRFVARRCPDDAVAAYPNCLTIGRIEPGDICSPNIEIQRDSFDFAAFYQGPRTWKSPFNIHRGLDLYRIVAGVDVKVGKTYPFSLKPAHRITADDIRRGLSSHYEGMPYEVKPKHPEKGPTVLEPICRRTTLESMVCEFGEKPEEAVLHIATGRPCETPYGLFAPFRGKLPGGTVTGADAVARIAEHFRSEIGGTVMPFGGSSFGGDAEKAAERMRIVKERGKISRFVMSGIGSSVRVNGIKGSEAYTALGRHIANVQRKVAADGIKIGFFMSPTLNCGINHPWAKFRNFDGTERAFTACPGEEGFRKDLAAKAAALAAEAHPFLYLMEDDFRYWGLGCFCGKHLRRFSEQTGVNRGREALVKALRAPGPEGQKLRMAWHRLQVSDLVAAAKEVSAAVDAVSPETRVGLCAPGGFPERETAEIACALAGKHRPVVRWYGSFYGYDFPVQTSGRLFSAQWVRENLSPGIEYMYEADPCPRTRFYASAARMEALISTTLASGFCLPLFQALLTREDALETAPDYLDMHGRCLGRFLAIKDEASKGHLVGVQAWFDSDMRVGGMGGDKKKPLDPEAWFRTLNRFGIPVTMSDAPVKLFAGHHTFRTMDDAAITNLLSGGRAGTRDPTVGVFLDGAAAEALTERGFAPLIGVKATMRDKIDFSGEHLVTKGEPITYQCAFHQNYGLDGCAVSRLGVCGGCGQPPSRDSGEGACPHAPKTEIVTEFVGNGKRQPAITYFENALGGRVAVMAVNLAGCQSSNVFNFRKRDLLVRILRRLGGDSVVPARILDRANVTLLANDDGERLFLHAMYLSCDPADSFTFEVLPPYAGCNVEVLDGAEWKPANAKWSGTRLTVHPPSKVKVYGTLDLRIAKKGVL